jgi:hypothetical protein
MIGFLLSLAIATLLAVTVHGATRRFVRDRLRYVDAVRKGLAPWLAGGAALLIAAPVMALLPIVGTGTAITVGLAVGMGVANGARDIKQGTAPVVWGS